MLELFHELDVNGNHTPQPHSQPLSRSRSGGGSGEASDVSAAAASNNMPDRMSGQSELAFALRQNEVRLFVFPAIFHNG